METNEKTVMERESFIFYTSWIEGLEDYSEKEQGEIILALMRYCAYGVEPKDAKRHVKMAFRYAKPQIDANNRKFSVGHNGGSRNGVSNNPLGRRGKTIGTNKKLTKNYLETNKKLTKNYQETTNGSSEELTKNYLETNKKLPNDNVNVNENENVNVNVNGNDNNVVTDFPDGKSLEKKEISLPDGNAKKSGGGFVKPTVDEVAEFLATKGLTREDAEQFWHFYESKGWFVGKNKMQIWRSAAAGWAHRENERRKYGNGDTDNTRAAGPLWTPTEDQREHPERYYESTFHAEDE